MGFFRGKLSAVLLVLEILMIILFAVFVRYEDSALPGGAENEDYYPVDKYYSFFQDVHVMMFVGFGFLMTFLKRYGYGSIGINFLLAAFVLQWATLFRGFTEIAHSQSHDEHPHTKIHVSIQSMLLADFTSATILISFGALLGKVSPLQLTIMAFFEVIFSLTNEFIGVEIIKTTDIGGSMYVHTFGAYFGLAVSRIVTKDAAKDNDREGAVYHSDLFSMIGTLFLWIFWPSFNSAFGEDDQRHRAVINTYFSLSACCVTTFAISSLHSKRGKFDMVHIQNATLAGGVAVGTAANLMIEPWGAILIGVIAGILSTLGFSVIQPFLLNKLGFHDTCGVHNLHGMPGIMGGLAGVIAVAVANEGTYNDRLVDVLPLFKDETINGTMTSVMVRTPGEQALLQLAALVITVVIAIVTGIITGFILLIPGLDGLNEQMMYEDAPFWEGVDPDESAKETPGYQIVQQQGNPEVEEEEGEQTVMAVRNGKEADAQV